MYDNVAAEGAVGEQYSLLNLATTGEWKGVLCDGKETAVRPLKKTVTKRSQKRLQPAPLLN